MGKVSICDVAKHAGVSIATVSYTINNTKPVNPETRQKVEASIKKLGYKPNMTARSFKTGKKNLVAFVVPDIANVFFATLIEEVETVLASKGIKLIILNTKETKQREIDNINIASSGLVDGFLIASTLEDFHELKGILSPSTPAVFIDRKIEHCPFETITVNCFEATCQGIEYLIAKGHKKIGYITGLPRISTTKERLFAYETVMRKYNLYDESLIRIGNSMSHCVHSHLTSILDSGCTAIVIANNIMATEAMTQMLESGILPGRDKEILGFQDSDQPQYGLQHMSLIYQPTRQLGKVAGEELLRRLEDPNSAPSDIILNAEFKPRK